MKPTCMIKSHPKGLGLILEPDCSFEDLILGVCALFAKSRDFFGEGDMALSIEGRSLDPKELLVLIEAIELNCHLKISHVIDEGELTDARMVGLYDRFYFDRADKNMKIVRGSVPAGKFVTSDTGLLIIGDLKKDAKAVAKGNICILGNLEGLACAGDDDNEDAFIVCGRLLTNKVIIGGVEGTVEVKKRRLLALKRPQEEPVVIRMIRGYFQTEPLSSGLIMQDK